MRLPLLIVPPVDATIEALAAFVSGTSRPVLVPEAGLDECARAASGMFNPTAQRICLTRCEDAEDL